MWLSELLRSGVYLIRAFLTCNSSIAKIKIMNSDSTDFAINFRGDKCKLLQIKVQAIKYYAHINLKYLK